MDILDIYDSLSQVQKTSIFMRKYSDGNIIDYMMDRGFYIDDAYFLLPFISQQFIISTSILRELVIRYLNEMNKLVATCPEYVTDNVYILLGACIKYENDMIIETIKKMDLQNIFEYDSKINVLSQFGYKLAKS